MASFTSELTVFEAVIEGNLDQLHKIHESNKSALNIRDGRGYQAVHLAAECGQSTVIQWLARNGFDLNTESSTGYYPIHIACARGNIDCVLALKMGGAQLNVKTSADQLSPMHVAAMQGNLDIVQFLMRNNVDPKEKNRFGHNVCEIAANNGHKELTEFLAKEMKLKEVPKIANVQIDENRRRAKMTDEEVKKLRMEEYKKMQSAKGGKATFMDVIRANEGGAAPKKK